MAAIDDLSAPKLMQNITLRVRFVNVLRFRIWLATRIMVLASMVAGCNIEFDTDETEGVTTRGAAVTEDLLRQVGHATDGTAGGGSKV